jgi:hypothetical protein
VGGVSNITQGQGRRVVFIRGEHGKFRITGFILIHFFLAGYPLKYQPPVKPSLPTGLYTITTIAAKAPGFRSHVLNL